MNIMDNIANVYSIVEPFDRANPCIRNPRYKDSSTKSGNNPKAIKARRKKNKNKKTHRK